MIVPFEEHPALWSTGSFGAPVVTGNAFTLRTDTGATLQHIEGKTWTKTN